MKNLKPLSSEINFIKSSKTINYLDGLSFMEKKVNQIIHNESKETIWLLEHNPVYTLGTSSKIQDYNSTINNIPIIKTNRGGKITWHGPGQRIIYIMLDIKKRDNDIRKFVFSIEEWIIKTLSVCNINAERRKGRIGVWVEDRDGMEKKIGSLGIRVRKGITFHGLSLNVDCNLDHFSKINPCGLKGFGVTSVKSLNKKISMDDIDNAFIKSFKGSILS